MIIIPLKNDKIETEDGGTFRVASYTNLKAEPAVYIEAGENANSIIYFQDIVSINGVRVTYKSSDKVFTALGTVRRKFNLPQPNDVITINGSDSNNTYVVKSLKLHNKKEGVTKGLLVCADDICHELTMIKTVDRSEGAERFDNKAFIKYYEDYLPMNY